MLLISIHVNISSGIISITSISVSIRIRIHMINPATAPRSTTLDVTNY